MIEEEIFYPACTGEIEEDLVKEAYVEHDGAKVMISELLASEPGNDFYDAKVKVLSEEIKHHVRKRKARRGHLRPGPGSSRPRHGRIGRTACRAQSRTAGRIQKQRLADTQDSAASPVISWNKVSRSRRSDDALRSPLAVGRADPDHHPVVVFDRESLPGAGSFEGFGLYRQPAGPRKLSPGAAKPMPICSRMMAARPTIPGFRSSIIAVRSSFRARPTRRRCSRLFRAKWLEARMAQRHLRLQSFPYRHA